MIVIFVWGQISAMIVASAVWVRSIVMIRMRVLLIVVRMVKGVFMRTWTVFVILVISVLLVSVLMVSVFRKRRVRVMMVLSVWLMLVIRILVTVSIL